MQAVLGAEVALGTGLSIASTFSGAHGLIESGTMHEESNYSVVGILMPTGTVLDRLVITDKASVWRVNEGERASADERAIMEAEREVTALLVRYASPLAAAIVPRQVNAESDEPAVELRLLAILCPVIERLPRRGSASGGAKLAACSRFAQSLIATPTCLCWRCPILNSHAMNTAL